MAAKPSPDFAPAFASVVSQYADDVMAGLIHPSPAHICALRKAVAAVARRARAADCTYDESGFLQHSED